MSEKRQQKIVSVIGGITFIGALLTIIIMGIISPEKPNFSGNANTTSNNPIKIEKESQLSSPEYITVKYRDDPVDVSGKNFEALDLRDLLNKYADLFSTGEIEKFDVRSAWYDQNEEYLIINLRGTNYHYCEMPVSLWDGLKRAGSVDRGSLEELDAYYEQNIKGNYDCRVNRLPTY